MKKILKYIGIGISAAILFFSCAKSEEYTPGGTIDMTVVAGDPSVKTVIDEYEAGGKTRYGVLWEAGDVLGGVIKVHGTGFTTIGRRESSPLTSGGETASFKFSGILSGTDYNCSFVYPASALTESGTSFLVTLPSAQTFASGSFDPAADVLLSEHISGHLMSIATDVNARFVRVGGTARMLITAPSTTETIQKIVFSTTDNIKIAGTYTLDANSGELSDEMTSGTNSISLTPASATSYDGDVVVWFRLAELTLSDNFTLSITTDKKVYTKNVNLAAAGRTLEFRNSKLTKFSVDMRGVPGVGFSSTDVLDADFTGITSTSYSSWSGKAGSSSTAVYAGYSARRDGGEIGIRSDVDYTGNFYSGIVTTASGGKLKEVSVTVTTTSNATRTVDIYASNTPYASPNDLYDSSAHGDLVASMTFPGNSTNTQTFQFTSDYAFIGIRSRQYAINIPEIRVSWEGGKPMVVTGGVSDVTYSSATLHGSFGAASGGIYEAGFYWDSDASALENLAHPAQVVTTDGTSATGGSFSCSLGSLPDEDAIYYYKAYVLWLNPETNRYEEYFGRISSFRTLAHHNSTMPIWLELPSYDIVDMAGTTTSPLDDLYFVTHWAQMGGIPQRNYSMLYDPAMYASYWVAYPLCRDHLTSGRTDHWGIFDPQVPVSKQVDLEAGYGVNLGDDYYARGHQIPNADRNAVPEMQEQTYYPTNITPQLQNSVNGGIWMHLEGGVRESVKGTDTVYVVTGAAFRKKGSSDVISTIQPTRGRPELPLPNYYWKVLLKVRWSGNYVTDAKAVGFWIEHSLNMPTEDKAYVNYAVSVDQIEAWTGFDFFANLPEELQAACESSSDWAAFKSY